LSAAWDRGIVSAAIDRVAEGGSRRAGGRQSGALAMLDPVGFWSYARQDDAHSDGQLSQLRAIVGKQIGLQFGAEVTLWQDIAAIPYGADWAEAIERTIGQTTFFIPIVTPRFLKSRYCREEFLSFRRRMQALGRGDLIFPVHYVDVADVRPEETLFGDDLAALKRSQWIDFRPLFYADPKSQEVRRWAGELAGDVLKALRRPVAAAPERAALHEAPRATEAKRIEETPPVAPEIAPPPKPLRPAPPPAGARRGRGRTRGTGGFASPGGGGASDPARGCAGDAKRGIAGASPGAAFAGRRAPSAKRRPARARRAGCLASVRARGCAGTRKWRIAVDQLGAARPATVVGRDCRSRHAGRCRRGDSRRDRNTGPVRARDGSDADPDGRRVAR